MSTLDLNWSYSAEFVRGLGFMKECHIKAAHIDSIKSIVSKLVYAPDLAFKVGVTVMKGWK